MDRNDAAAAAAIAGYLRYVNFPARRPDLITAARDNHATEDVLSALRTLPGEDTYVSPQHVWAAIESVKRHKVG
jgi:hypothetical protein